MRRRASNRRTEERLFRSLLLRLERGLDEQFRRRLRIGKRHEPFPEIVQRQPGFLKPFREHGEDAVEIVVAGQPVVARGAEVRAAQSFVITQTRSATSLGAEENAVGKNAGEKQRVIPDVRANVEEIGRASCRERVCLAV